MSPLRSQRREPAGTKFRLFPQPPFLEAFWEPETVYVSSPAGTLGPGPSDNEIYVIQPIDKPAPYGVEQVYRGAPSVYLPPWTGDIHPPAMPGPSGHFDHLEPDSPEFQAAHLFASVRFVMDVWEGYFGRPIKWHFRRDYERMELVLLPGFDNATMGYGFMEVGGITTKGGAYRPFSLNFDVIAHEVGHAIIYSEVGIPTPETEQGEYFGFHESAADLVALISSLHFDSVVDHVLANTRGNLYTLNKLNRFAELSRTEQIRLAANDYSLSEFERGWIDEHDLAQPLTGATFDILVDIFHEQLLERGLISAEMEDLSDQLEGSPEYEAVMQSLFDATFQKDPDGFKEALLEARDFVGTYLADTWMLLDPDFLNYEEVGAILQQVDRDTTGGRYRKLIAGNFKMRDIGLAVPGPRLSPPGPDSHSFSSRTMIPAGR